MSMTVVELRRWLSMLPDDATVGIDEGGLILESDTGQYLEIGGIPDDVEAAIYVAPVPPPWPGSGWTA